MGDQPNILLLLSDEHSFRFMNYMTREQGGEALHAPTFDKLAAEGTVFDTVYCPVPLCTPSRSCFLTGQDAPNCGAADNSTILDPELDTLPKMLVRAGYETALVGKMHFHGSNQFHGFRHRPFGDLVGNAIHQWERQAYDDGLGGGSAEPPEGIAYQFDDLTDRTMRAGVSRIPEGQTVDRMVAEETLAFLRNQKASRKDQPWFMCASFSRPHFPLSAPKRWIDFYRGKVTEPFVGKAGDSYDHPVSVAIREGFETDRIDAAETQNAREAYFACLSYLDEIIGDLLLRLENDGLLENTIIVYTSDHGEMLGELGTWWKSGWYEGCARVPLIVSTSDQRKGRQQARRVSDPISLIDLCPTLAKLGNGAPAGAIKGLDFSDAVTGNADIPLHPVFCDHLNDRWGPGTAFRAIRYGKWKYVKFRDAPSLLFDMDVDLAEANNLFETAPESLIRELDAFMVDWDYVEGPMQDAQKELKKKFHLKKPKGCTANQYMIPEGRIVAADVSIYDPVIVTNTPETYFTDWPLTPEDLGTLPPKFD